MESQAIGWRLRRPHRVGLLTAAFVIAIMPISGCRVDGLTTPSLQPEIKVDPALAERLKSQHFTGAVISYVSLSNGSIRSRPSQAVSSAVTPNQGLTATLLTATSLTMSMDLTSDLMFVVQPAGSWKTPGGNPQFAFKLFWNCYIGGIDYGRIKNVTVGNITNNALEGSGGHTGSHLSPKPFGTTDPFTGATDGDGFFTTAYTATDISGDESMDVDWSTTDQSSECVGFAGTDRYWHATRWDGLSRLTASPDFTFGPIASHHDDIYYAAAGMDTRVHKAAKAYSLAFHGANALTVTAASLVYGGLEDVAFDWSEPHQLHRTGADVDFDGAADNHKIWDPLIKIATRSGPFRKCEVHSRNHIHCYTTQYHNPNL